MKNTQKILGIIALMAVMALLMTACSLDGGQSLSLNGDWVTTGGTYDIRISGNTGVFTKLNPGGPFYSAGARVGDQFLRYITQTGERTWSADAQYYSTPSYTLGWSRVTITMSENGKSLHVTSGTTADMTVSFARK